MVRGDGTTFGIRSMFKSTPTSSKVNWWNSNKRWGRCYTTDEGLLVLSQDVEITGDATEANIVECLKTWMSLFKSWKENVVE